MTANGGRTRQLDARTGCRPPGTASRRRQQRAARGAGALYRDRGSCRRRRKERFPLSRALRRLAAVRRRALHPSRLGEVPVARSLFDDRDAARLLSPIPARAVAPAGQRIRRPHRGQAERAGDPLSLRHRGRRRVRARRSLGRPTWRAISRRPCWPMSATRWSTAPGSAARAGRGRSRCSTPCASISRCAGSSTTPAATGGRCSPGSCSPTTSATSISSWPGRSPSCASRTAPIRNWPCRAAPSCGAATNRRRSMRRSPARRGIASRCRPTI